MIDLAKYHDDEVLSTDAVAEWLGMSVKSVLRMGLPLANVRKRGHYYLAGAIKAHIRNTPAPRVLPLRRAS